MNYFRYSKCARARQVDLADSRFGSIIALVLTYLWLECHGAVLSVTDLPQIQRWHQPYADHLFIGYLGTYGLVLGINVKLSSSSFQWYLR